MISRHASPDLATTLKPVRRALLDDAVDESARLTDAARAEIEHRLRDVRDETDREVERARQRALATATARADRAIESARNDARRHLLATEAHMWNDLADRVVQASRAMMHDPRYPELLAALEALARRQLGDDAVIEPDADVGGLTASAGGRRVDYRLPTLARRALTAITDEAVTRWS